MSAPFDLSDALKAPPASSARRPGGKGKRQPPTNVRLDEFCRKIIWITFVVSVLLLIYQGWGMYSGSWANPTWHHQSHDFRAQQIANIALTSGILRVCATLLIVGLVIVFRNDEGAGYALLAFAVFLYAVTPLVTQQVFNLQVFRSTEATEMMLQNWQLLGLIYGVPGVIWSVIDITRHIRSATEIAAVRRANHKYATAAKAHALGVNVQKRGLTAHQKRERLYQGVSIVVVIGEPALIFFNLSTVQGWLEALLNVTNRLSFSTKPGGISQLHGSDGTLVLWILLIAFNFVIIAQLLKLVELIIYKDTI